MKSHSVNWWSDLDISQFVSRWNLPGEGYVQDDKNWPDVKIRISGISGKDYYVQSSIEQGVMLDMTKKVLWSAVAVLALVSAYQMCSLLILLGVHFGFEIAMVRSMGFSRRDIMLVFLIASCLFAICASVLGAAVGLGAIYAYNHWFGYFSEHFNLSGLVIISNPSLGFWGVMLGSWLLGITAGLFPSWLAAKADPAVIWRDT